jgi:ABC-type proline/glycine betaine transport system permease subunit
MMTAISTFPSVRAIAPFRNVNGIGKLSSIVIFASFAIIPITDNVHPIIPFSHVAFACL